jgi:protein involved in polysaccharide export with SLBB domain
VRSACFLLLFLFVFTGCSAGPKTPVPITEQGEPDYPAPSLSSVSPAYIIQPGDDLAIKFYYNPPLDESVTVRPDGRISLQLVQEVQASSLTTSELAAVLREKYASYINDPEISVIVRSFDSRKIFVDGEVGSPGMIVMGGYMSILQSIASAGGLKTSALDSEVLVIRRNGLKKPFVLKVDVAAAMNGTDTSQDITLKPYDIIFVPKSAIANINTWVDLYIRKNIPFTLSYGIFKSVQ